jgi:hypothetical protein
MNKYWYYEGWSIYIEREETDMESMTVVAVSFG